MTFYLEGERPLWHREGRDWPNREASRFVKAAGFRWHVQVMGAGPVLLLLHGTGAATHSWRDLAPGLARDFTVVAPDLPGHGFTDPPPLGTLTLPGMATAVRELLDELRLEPVVAAGHSAGAAVLVRMALDGQLHAGVIVSLNGALLPYGGDAGPIASSLAKLLFSNPFTPRLFAWRMAERSAAARIVERSGSSLEPRGLELYARLARRPAHVGAALGMMAGWDLETLDADLPRLTTPLVLVAGSNDRAVSPCDARRVQAIHPPARVVDLPGLGHLAHEEDPEAVAGLIRREAAGAGVAKAA
jgi:magnesium chelatase accessory protein